jgi:hypothetical protein
MPYIGGTPEVQNFIKKYKASGHLIDPYSDEWISQVANRAENNEINYESDPDTYESFDEEYGKDYRDHLLIVYVDIYNKELLEDLKKIYQPLKYIFDGQSSAFGTHKPDFLFINLATKQILCAGLGRKNKLMQFDAARYAAGKHEPLIDVLTDGDANFDSKYVAKFTALDHDEIISKLIYSLKILGDYLLENDRLNFYPEIISIEPNDEGLYIFEDDREPVDQAGLDALIDSAEINATYISESIEAIQVFFPKADVADLNPEDY